MFDIEVFISRRRYQHLGMEENTLFTYSLSAGVESKHSCWVLTHLKTFAFKGILKDHHLRLLDEFHVTKSSEIHLRHFWNETHQLYGFLSHLISEYDASRAKKPI